MATSARALARKLVPRRRPRLGALRRTTPLSDHWGADRGTPIDRYYIERFLRDHRSEIRGKVLEVKDTRYTDSFGVGVERSDVLDIDDTNRAATIVADLSSGEGLLAETFDCFVCTQTLQSIYDVPAAVEHSHRLLRQGGSLLVTVPSVSKIDRNAGVDGACDFWRFTSASCRRLFGQVFGEPQVEVRTYGNVLAAVGFLTGLASEELSESELDLHDEFFPVLVGIHAVKL